MCQTTYARQGLCTAPGRMAVIVLVHPSIPK